MGGPRPLRYVVVAALLSALVRQVAAADSPRPVWELLTTAKVAELQVDPDGRIWTIDPLEGVRLLQPRRAGPGSAGGDGGWRSFPMPQGYVADYFAVTGGDTLYVGARSLDRSRDTVFRRRLTGDSPWEELPLPNPYGTVRSMAADGRGRLWAGGERGEIFRLEGERWEREVLPAPLHCEAILAAADDVLWVHAQARAEMRILMRKDGVWRTVVAASDSGHSGLLYAGAEMAVLRINQMVKRVSARNPGELENWFEPQSQYIAVESPMSAWIVRGGHLLHAVGDSLVDCGALAFLPWDIRWRNGQLWSCSEAGLWRLTDRIDPRPPTLPLGLVSEYVSPMRADRGIYGMAAMTLEGRPHVYLTRHAESDAVFPVGSDSLLQTWVQVSRALGLEARDESLEWALSYEMAVAVADLNADRREDVLLSTMYDGVRLLRNMSDRRLVPWTQQSGLRAFRRDVAEDIDLLDADDDGDLDLYVSNLQGNDRLCLNDGAGRFVDLLPESGIASPYGSTAALCRDLDADGDTDIAVSTCGGGLFLHENLGPLDGRPRFRTQVLLAPIVHPEVPTGLSTANFVGIEAQDFDGDGRFDLIVGGRSQPTLFLRNRGTMRFDVDQSIFADGPPQPKVAGVVAFDPDADGDWDLALTGSGGARFLENVDGLLGHPGGREPLPMFAPSRYSTGSILIDFDGDLDLDYLETSLDGRTFLYNNANARKPLLVTVRGPQENAGAVGARVEVLLAGTGRRAAPPQEIPGGSGYASHGSKTLAFGGLAPDALYDVSVRLPSGKQARLDGVPGRGAIVVDMEPGLRGRLAAAPVRFAAAWRDRWTRAFGLATAASVALLIAFGAAQKRRLGGAFPWPGVVATIVIAFGIRQLLHLDPGGVPVITATLGGLAAGLLVVGLVRPGPRAPSASLLADFSRSLRVFEHNQTPRKILDRIMLVRANVPEGSEERRRVMPLLREDVSQFGVVVAPELAFVVEGARSAGLDHERGAALLKKLRGLQRRLLDGDDAAWASPRSLAALDALLAATAEFRAWVESLHREVDRRLATPLVPFLDRYAGSRMKLHDASISTAVPPAVVRLPEAEFARVLDVLLENALHACAGRTVAFRIVAEAPAGGRLRLRAGDDGPGVPSEIRPRLFQAGASAYKGGNGYGLFAARCTLEHFGGRIGFVESASGACFEIELETIRDGEG